MALPDDGKRYELIEGELVLNPAPNTRHQRLQRKFLVALDNYFSAHRNGEVFNAPFDVVLSEDVVLEPDVVVVLKEHAARIGTNNLQGPPDLAIEILSPGTRRKDEILKRRLYEHHGVNEYWIVDPEEETVRIYRRDGETFAAGEVVEIITSPLLPGFSLDVRDVFAQ